MRLQVPVQVDIEVVGLKINIYKTILLTNLIKILKFQCNSNLKFLVSTKNVNETITLKKHIYF